MQPRTPVSSKTGRGDGKQRCKTVTEEEAETRRTVPSPENPKTFVVGKGRMKGGGGRTRQRSRGLTPGKAPVRRRPIPDAAPASRPTLASS